MSFGGSPSCPRFSEIKVGIPIEYYWFYKDSFLSSMDIPSSLIVSIYCIDSEGTVPPFRIPDS